ncbi:MAG: LTA synthase family protein [Lachnospiraceae bacterium]|nr:LTA synthase family protein [Lachnospiraceae bacterium]
MKEKLKNIKDWVIFLLIPTALFYLSQNTLSRIRSLLNERKQFANIVFLFLLLLFVSFIIKKVKISSRILTVFIWVWSIINAYVYEFRGSYILPWDLYSAGTALGVAGNFSYMPTKRMVITTILFILLFVIEGFCELDFGKYIKKIRYQIILLMVVIIGIGSYTKFVQTETADHILSISTRQFDPAGLIYKNGPYLGFLYELKYFAVEKVDGYSASEQKNILDSIDADTVSSNIMPDIIVIMNETFSDPAVNGEIKTNEDYMPFVHSLQNGAENTQTGYLNMSVLGGNTANSEFEFLTGDSMAFLPQSSIAYQQLIHKDNDTLASYLKTFGYSTLVMHPYLSSGWNRTSVYPKFGFDDMYFLDGYFDKFSDVKYIREYVSDESHYDRIIKEVEERSSNGPVFSFNITMQNHCGYDDKYDNLPWQIRVADTDDEDEDLIRLNNYINLIKLSDSALEDFIDYYKKVERPTLIVFFGDHQPQNKILSILFERNGIDIKNLTEDEVFKSYMVPFVVWANYDIEEKNNLEMSVNYFGNLVLKDAGIPLSRYRQFIDEYSKKYPVISAIRTVDAEGNSYATEDVVSNMSDYAAMQYYQMFDDKDDYK